MPEQKHSVCALDCPDTCALVLNIDAAGHATKIAGDPQHPITRGFLCGKVAKYLEREYHPGRLLYPLRRTGAKGEGSWKLSQDGFCTTWGGATIANCFTVVNAGDNKWSVMKGSTVQATWTK